MELAGVTEHVVNLGSVKAPGVETILAEEIDFVILSAAIEGHVSVRETLNAAGVTTAYFEVEHFEDYRDMMQIFTAITGGKICTGKMWPGWKRGFRNRLPVPGVRGSLSPRRGQKARRCCFCAPFPRACGQKAAAA